MKTTYMIHKMKRHLSLLLAALAMLLPASCDKDIHESEYPLADGQGALIVGLESEAEVTDLTVCILGEGGIAPLYKVFDDPRTLASEYLPVNAGSYTVIIIANADGASLPQETTVADLTEWLKAHAADFPYMLTASEQVEVASGDIERLHLVDGRHEWHPPLHGAPRAHCAWA